jgi:hypothetical protein
MAYLLDANVFIQGKNLYYGFDFCPAFWDWLIKANAAGIVYSIDRVEGELAGLGDDLSVWASQRGAGFFLKPDNAVLPSLRTISAWASGQNYEPAAVNLFLQVADYYLVAHAHAHGHMVVTHEISSVSTKRIKIPDACIANGVTCMTPYDMLRREHAKFVLP